MRFLSVLSSLALLSSTVSATCVSGVTPNQAVFPEPEGALTLFVTFDFVSSGQLVLEPGSLNGVTFAPAGAGGDGLTAADNICTHRASLSTEAKNTFNRNQEGGTVQFKAILSSSTVNAIDRIADSANIQSYANSGVTPTGFQCLAADRTDLFSAAPSALPGNPRLGYNFNNLFRDENGDVLPNSLVWTATGIPAEAKSTETATAAVYGGKYYVENPSNTEPTYDAAYTAATTCGDWKTGGSGTQGVLAEPGGGAVNTWIQKSVTPQTSCDNGFKLICISAQPFQAPTPPPSVTGDPQFTGLQGQSFQVHGMPEEYFNLITTPSFQLNSRFTYLASGNCNYNNTECWTHPGTYVDQLGLMFPGLNLKTVAGAHHKGMRVWVNNEEMPRSQGRLIMSTTSSSNTTSEVTISHPHHDILSVSFPLFTLEITNSDWFFNFALVFHAPEVLAAGRDLHFLADSRASTKATTAHYQKGHVYPQYQMHGLVGQTWKNARYPSKRMYQGEVDDYMLLDHQLFSTQFMYNIYQY